MANALVHAYYGASGSVRIVLRPDRLEVTNPGAMLVDREVAIAGGFSEPRNPALMRIFSFIGVSDRATLDAEAQPWARARIFGRANPTSLTRRGSRPYRTLPYNGAMLQSATAFGPLPVPEEGSR